MIRLRNRRKGISAIIGTAIALSIVFTIIIPLFLYMQSLQSLFMQEANRRLQYELERLNERLEIYVSLSKNIDGFGRRQLYLIVTNPGIISVAVPAVYLESGAEGLRRLEHSFLISPGQKIIRRLDHHFSPHIDDEVRVKLVTLRGNSFISKDTIGLRKLPYLLIASVENMTIGFKYIVKVEVSGESEYGCILSEVSQLGGSGEICGTMEEHTLIPYTYTDRDGIAVFMVAPGSYIVKLIVKDLHDNVLFEYEWSILDVQDDVILRLSGPPIASPKKIPLRLYTLSYNTVSILTDDVGVLMIPYIVSLGNQSEPIMNLRLNITINEHIGLSSVTVNQYENVITRIHPGESYVGYFILNVKDDSAGKFIKYGGKIRFSISIKEALGEISRRSYPPDHIEVPTISSMITLCRTNSTGVLYCEAS